MEYEKRNKANNILIGKAIAKAIQSGDDVWYKNYYYAEDREDGTPDYNAVNTNEVQEALEENGLTFETMSDEDYFDWVYDIVLWQEPAYSKFGCNDLIIEKDDEEIYLWYSDVDEDRVYVEEIAKYLEQQGA